MSYYEIDQIKSSLMDTCNNLDMLTNTMEMKINGTINVASQLLESKLSTNINTNVLTSNNGYMDRLIVKDSIESNSHIFMEQYKSLKINANGIFSHINNGDNALILLETIKNILIKNSYCTEEEFIQEYDNTERKIQDIIDSKKVSNKLTEGNE